MVDMHDKCEISPEDLDDLFRDGVAIEPYKYDSSKDDKINHPSYYTYGKIETIDFIMDKELDFCRGNAVKYIVRAGRKPGCPAKEDINKAIKYLTMYRDKLKD